MAWYNKGKKKPAKKPPSDHTVKCEECGRIHRALDYSWTCNGNGEVLCNGKGECFEMRMLRSMGGPDKAADADTEKENQGSMELFR